MRIQVLTEIVKIWQALASAQFAKWHFVSLNTFFFVYVDLNDFIESYKIGDKDVVCWGQG